MSVRGEFLRVLGSLIEFLEASQARGAESAAGTLRGLHGEEVRDLSVLAESALDACAPGGLVDGVGYTTASERERADENREHLAAICRAILGRGNAVS